MNSLESALQLALDAHRGAEGFAKRCRIKN